MAHFFLCYYRNLVRETNLTNVVILFLVSEGFPPVFPLETRKSFVFWRIFSKDGIAHYVFSGSQVDFSNKFVLQSLNIAFIIEKSADPDQASKNPLVRSYLRVPQAAGQVKL